jgi:hypothetical protein
MRRAILISLIAIFSLTGVGAAQEAPCGLRTMTEGATPYYPAIARAAQFGGTVIFLVEFKLDGSVGAIQKVSGAPLLEIAATQYVKSWKANPYTGPRKCPVVITYIVNQESFPDGYKRFDMQHVSVYAPVYVIDSVISDPMPLNRLQILMFRLKHSLQRMHLMKDHSFAY